MDGGEVNKMERGGGGKQNGRVPPYRYYVGPMEPQEAEETASKISQFELFTLSN